jgi:transcriptional regulator with XRE-family HTH domain
MIIGERIRELREEKDMSQGEIQKKTGLLRCHISRVENGRTVPGIETLEKMARALDVPLYRLFYDGEKPPALKNALRRRSGGEDVWGTTAGLPARLPRTKAPYSLALGHLSNLRPRSNTTLRRHLTISC